MIAIAAVVALLAGEALSVYVVNELLIAGFGVEQRNAAPAIVLVIVAFAAFGLPRLVEGLALTGRTANTVAAAGAFTVLYGAMRIAFAGDLAIWDFAWAVDFLQDSEESAQNGGAAMIGSIGIVAVWVLASRRASDEIELERVPKSIGVHFAIVTVVLVLSVYSDREGIVARGGAAFYAVAVISLACSQLGLSGATYGDLRAGGTAGILLLGTLAATVVGVLVFGVVFAFLGPRIGPPLGDALEAVAYVVLYPPAWILNQIFNFLLGGGDTDILGDLSPFADQAGGEPGDPGEQSGVERAGEYGLRSLGLVLAVAALAGAAALYFRFRKPGRARLDDGSTASSAGSVQEDLRGLLRGLFRRGPQGDVLGSRSGVTRLYAEVLADARERGSGRSSGQTADEFAPVLAGLFRSGVTDEITAAFDQARYAGREPDDRKVEDLRRRWRESRR